MKEIGSEFNLDPSITKQKNVECAQFFPARKKLFLSTGRDSLVYAIRAHNIKKMLVPAYLEESVIHQILNEGVKLRLYEIDNFLRINLTDLEKKTECVDALLVVHYFGFPQEIDEIRSLCDRKNLLMIEDCVQSMLSCYHGKPVGSFGDVYFNSLRKFIGIPDGSILISSTSTKIIETQLHKEFVRKRLDALIGKFFYQSGNKKYSRFYFKEVFVQPENIIDNYKKPAPMSVISKKILNKTDFNEIIQIRRRNFKHLLSKLNVVSLYNKLPTHTCPLGFPIIVRKRDKIKNLLIENKIYPPIHWNLPNVISKKFKQSKSISENILTIPIDQRYSLSDMRRIIDVLESNGVLGQ
jgi:dTDP-4-amino-4,6-dideoxygalactose transaminase